MSMRKKIKICLFAAGLVMLFLILQHDFKEEGALNSWSLPLSGKVILLDPGHGGMDPGAVVSGTVEKKIALDVSFKLRDFLQEQGALVIMTREDDSDLADEGLKGIRARKVQDLKRRVETINKSEADLFVSIHLNAIPSPKWSGAQTFYSGHFKESKRAAKLIQKELRAGLQNTDRVEKVSRDIYLLKHTKKPGVLVEIGFLTNARERNDLQKEEYQEKVAASIYQGIIRYAISEKK